MSKIIIVVIIILVLAVIFGYMLWTKSTPAENKTDTSAPKTDQGSQDIFGKQAVLDTSMGQITIEFYPEDAPKAVENFLGLAKKGNYNGVIFHRVIKDFMIQGGDPTGTGRGGESIFGAVFKDELNPAAASYQAGYRQGVVAMANRGPNTNGSQFFIMLKDNPLDHLYTIFGHVVAGQEVVDNIGATQTDKDDKPVTPVVIKTVTIKDK